MVEEWRDIAGHDGYQVSNLGNVRSYLNGRHGVIDQWHLLRPVANIHGYYTVCLGRGKRRLIHRLVAEAFIENSECYPIVRHLDDDPSNNLVSNLAWGTQTDNMQDCVQHGRLVGDTSFAIKARKKKVLARRVDGSEELIFQSYSDAARFIGDNVSHITRVIKGDIKQSHGWVFEPLEGDCE